MNDTESLRRIILQSINVDVCPDELHNMQWYSVHGLLRTRIQKEMRCSWDFSMDLKRCLLNKSRSYGTISNGFSRVN